MAKVDAERSTPRQLWHSIDALLGRDRVPPLHEVGATEFHRFFEAKVTSVWASTADAPLPPFTSAPSGYEMHEFRPLTVSDVVRDV